MINTNEENSLLIQFLGDSGIEKQFQYLKIPEEFYDNPMTRIVDFLIENKGFDYSKEEIAKGSSVSRTTLFKYWEWLEKFGIVKVTRTYGKTKLYTLNVESEVVKAVSIIAYINI
ncbi:hypothetical protein BEH94_05080 [Candidatus Altiarchaeales archaeon WOR_SM1_SCG]|nr:hypothetical protein BEH94_05080 [Candidatus Altiarchaeales archaeon WOR_SM1_SCG]